MQTGELVSQLHTWEISDLGILIQNSSTPENLWPNVSLRPSLWKNPSVLLPFHSLFLVLFPVST